MRQLILAAVMVMGLALPVGAQTQETTVVTLATQQRQGTFQTTSYVVPPLAAGHVKIALDIPTSDYDNTANTVTYRLYWLDVLNGGIWRLYLGGSWVGGRVEDWELGTNPAPFIETNLEPLRGQTVRAEIEVPNRMRIGCSIVVR